MKHKTSKRRTTRTVDNFFDSWSENMAYILGYFAADGCMYRNKRGSFYVAFTSTDRELIDIVKKLMNVSNTIENYTSPKHNWKSRYVLQIGSKNLYKRLLELGFTPRKSLTLSFPPIPDTVVNHFIRGYFDGDGNAYYGLSKRSNRNGYARHLHLSIRCASKNFMEDLRAKILSIYKIGSGSLSFHSRAFTLAYSGKDVVKLYGFLYPNKFIPHLERKRRILEKGIEILRP